jgi:cytochrome c5
MAHLLLDIFAAVSTLPVGITCSLQRKHMKNYLLSSIVVAGSLLVATQAYAASGKDVYEASCVACHASGAAGAPKLEDKAAWAPRLSSGAAALHTSAIKGKGAMPAKGGNAALSDADVTAAVDFMMSKAK